MSAYYQFLVIIKNNMEREKSMIIEGITRILAEFLLPFFILF
jgi:hypothetical protein